MNQIDESINNSSNTISRNIEILNNGTDTGLLSQNILSQLRTFVESVALKIYSDENDAQVTYNDIKNAIRHIKSEAKYKFISDFHQSLSITKSHYIFDDENSIRILHKYIEYLTKIRALFSEEYNMVILDNLHLISTTQDKELSSFYNSIAERLNLVPDFDPNKNTWTDYCTIIKKRPFVVNEKIYYEITFSLATNTSNKSERVIAYTKHDIFDDYNVKLSIEKVRVNLLEKEMPINVINGWVVAIMPSALNRLSRIMGINTVVKSNMNEYERVMTYIKTQQYNLLELVLENEHYYKATITKIKQSLRVTYICNLLDSIREFILSNNKGQNIIKYLLLCLDLDVINNQYSYESCNYLSGLKLKYGCIPFEEMPYASSLIVHNPKLYSIFRCVSPKNREHEFLARRIKNNTEINGKIYTDIEELQDFDNIDKLISIFNSNVYYKHEERKIIKYNKFVYIREYEDNTISIIRKLNSFSASGLTGFSNFTQQWINEQNPNISNDKKDVLRKLFADSKVALIYGAAGTGKTTLIKHLSELFRSSKKFYLANTHPAVQNLKRRVGFDLGNYSTISSCLERNTKIACDILFVDECSTVSNKDFLKVLNLIDTKLVVLVGDIHQIESIRFGNWFMLVKRFLPNYCSFELTEAFRSTSTNLKNLWDSVRNMDGHIEEHLARNNSSAPLNSTIFENIDNKSIILCLNYDGLYGVNNINRFLQAANPNPEIEWGIYSYKVGDPILFTDSERFKPAIYNNLKGKIVAINKQDSKIIFDVQIDRTLTEIDVFGTNLTLLDCSIPEKSCVRFTINKYINDDEIDHNTIVPFQIAYAVSIHKAQGLEYDTVKIVINDEIGELITHNIFYTAITRARNILKIYWSFPTQEYVLQSMKLPDISRDANIFKQKYNL